MAPTGNGSGLPQYPLVGDPKRGSRGGGSWYGNPRLGGLPRSNLCPEGSRYGGSRLVPLRKGGSRLGCAGAGDLKLLALLLAVVLIVVAALGYFGAPFLEAATTALAPGMGLKTGIIWGFGVTVTLFVLFAMVAGDGLFGELPFMLGAFFLFFAVFSLLITWIF